MDDVNKPKHYTQGSIECIDAIDAMLEESGGSLADFYRTQVVKYMWRLPHKGSPKKDALKAEFYLNMLIDSLD
jgi:hypothetical protein